MRLRNFRCYRDEIELDLDDFTALMGANDVGKSTFLDALAIFFETKKVDQQDACLNGDAKDMAIICEFDDLPEELVIDATNLTSLQDEYLLNSKGRLEIHKVFNGALKSPKAKTHIVALHPSTQGVGDLLRLKRADLKKRCEELEVDLTDVNQNYNSELRRAIRQSVEELKPIEQPIETDLDGTKEIFPRILEQLPAFFLFTADRPSTDQDSEAQDPMKAAVRLAIENQSDALSAIATAVEKQISEIVDTTLSKVREMAPELADELVPDISPPRWDSVFKIGLTSDSEIPLNKRGSGVRRLILLGFLQAQAATARIESPGRGTIYAIEEPETSQHPDKQRALLDTLREIASDDGYQVLMTTHTPNLVRVLPRESLRFINRNDTGREVHTGVDDETCELVRQTLGVHPDHDVRVFVGVEGIHDESFLIGISEALSETDDQVKSLAALVSEGRVIFVPQGGSSLTTWVSRLKGLRCAEYHLFDRDFEPPAAPHYADAAEQINQREGASACHTTKREMENYLHPDAIAAANSDINLQAIGDFDDVPMLVAEADAAVRGDDWGDLSSKARKRRAGHAKRWLNGEASKLMTAEMLDDRDGLEEVSEWLREITRLASDA